MSKKFKTPESTGITIKSHTAFCSVENSDEDAIKCNHCGEQEDISVGLYLYLNENGICEECRLTGVVSVNR